jgi:hypothetical protein
MTAEPRVGDRSRGLYGFVIRHDPDGGDDEAAGTAGEVVPRVGIQIVRLRFMFHEGLIAFAGFAVDFFPRHDFHFRATEA